MSATTVRLPSQTQPRRAGSEPPSLARLARVELRKSYDTRAGFWLLLVIALTSVAVVALQMYFSDAPTMTFAEYFTATQMPTSVLLPVLGILLVTSEWSQKTAMGTFVLVPVRSRVLTAKLLAGTVLALLGVTAAGVASAAATLLTPVLTDAGSAWSISGGHLGQVVAVQVVSPLIGEWRPTRPGGHVARARPGDPSP